MNSRNFNGKMIKKEYRSPQDDIWDTDGHSEDEYIAPKDFLQICDMQIQDLKERKQVILAAIDGDYGEYLSRYYSTLPDGSYPDYKQLVEDSKTISERRKRCRIKKSDSGETKRYKIQQRDKIGKEIKQLHEVDLKFYDVNLKKTDAHKTNIDVILERWASFLIYADDERKETEEITYTQRGLDKAEKRTAELDETIFSTFEILDVDGKVDYHDTETIDYLLATNPDEIRDVRLSDVMMDFQNLIDKAGLTEREKQVCSLLRKGHNQKDVAEVLSTSKQNVSKMIKNIVKKIQKMVD